MQLMLALLGVSVAGFLLFGCQSAGSAPRGADRDEAAIAAVSAVLDALHDCASRADGQRYFALFAPDAVFLGTDATERWSLDEFRDYARPHFAAGRGWTYTVNRRFIGIGPSGDTAWFDESLANARLGECRGSGVLVQRKGAWRIAQYNLTIPVPNELAEDLARRIRER